MLGVSRRAAGPAGHRPAWPRCRGTAAAPPGACPGTSTPSV